MKMITANEGMPTVAEKQTN